MTDEIPCCPYCNSKVRMSTRLMGMYYVNEGMDSPWHYVQKKRYKHQVICNKCFMRGPLMSTTDDAINAYEKLVRRTS